MSQDDQEEGLERGVVLVIHPNREGRHGQNGRRHGIPGFGRSCKVVVSRVVSGSNKVIARWAGNTLEPMVSGSWNKAEALQDCSTTGKSWKALPGEDVEGIPQFGAGFLEGSRGTKVASSLGVL